VTLITTFSYILLCGRERTAASKQNVDAFNLQLQNLRYEVLHLRKEVSRCINFRSADENIRLVPVEEFYREADPDISQPDTTQGDTYLMEIL
jgi:THO complex subunit 5